MSKLVSQQGPKEGGYRDVHLRTLIYRGDQTLILRYQPDIDRTYLGSGADDWTTPVKASLSGHDSSWGLPMAVLLRDHIKHHTGLVLGHHCDLQMLELVGDIYRQKPGLTVHGWEYFARESHDRFFLAVFMVSVRPRYEYDFEIAPDAGIWREHRWVTREQVQNINFQDFGPLGTRAWLLQGFKMRVEQAKAAKDAERARAIEQTERARAIEEAERARATWEAEQVKRAQMAAAIQAAEASSSDSGEHGDDDMAEAVGDSEVDVDDDNVDQDRDENQDEDQDEGPDEDEDEDDSDTDDDSEGDIEPYRERYMTLQRG